MSQVSSLVIVKASELGCVLDCVLTTGLTKTGGVATDNTAILNAFLATATATNPVHLIIDGGTVAAGLMIPPGCSATIEGLGWDTGIYQKSGANADSINNAGTKFVSASIGTPPSRSGNIIIRNLFINGNRGTGTNGNCSGTGPTIIDLMGLSFFNVLSVTIDNVSLYDISAYGVWLNNCGSPVVTRYRCVAPTFSVSTDGIHVDGPSDALILDDFFIVSGDDAIALNAPEQFGGDIKGAIISNGIVNALTFARIYSSDATGNHLIGPVVITNCTATLTQEALLSGIGSSPGASNSIASVQISNCEFTAPKLGSLNNNLRFLEISNIVVNMTGTTGFQFSDTVTVGTIKISGLSVLSGTLAYLVDVPAGDALTALLLDNFDSRNVTALVGGNGFTQITNVGGTGVRAAGFEIPDAKMLNNSDYLSATSHLPSIKIAGTVKTYTVT